MIGCCPICCLFSIPCCCCTPLSSSLLASVATSSSVTPADRCPVYRNVRTSWKRCSKPTKASDTSRVTVERLAAAWATPETGEKGEKTEGEE